MLKGYTNDYKVGFVDNSGTYFVRVYEDYSNLRDLLKAIREDSHVNVWETESMSLAEVVSMERIPKISEIS